MDPTTPPTALDLKKDKGLTIEWADGSTSYYTIAHLRRLSPAADQKQLRKEMHTNPLTVLTQPRTNHQAPLTITHAELVGNYAIRFVFADGHASGIYSWAYLHAIDPIHTPPSEPGTSVPESEHTTDTPTPD